LADHIGQFPVVMISPYDRDLISEGSELRREWMDGIIAQFDRVYLENIQRYAKILEQRNALLKNMFQHGLFDRESIEVWNEQLVTVGNQIHLKRQAFIEEFIPHVSSIIPALVIISQSSKLSELRGNALKCLLLLVQTPYSRIHPLKQLVIKEVGKVLDDKKRNIRQLASTVRNAWIVIK
jgi:recombinational DNA repair ATPase RecF